MNFVRIESGRNLLLVAVAVIATTAVLFYMAPGTGTVTAGPNETIGVVATPNTTFPGTGVGGIPDGTTSCWSPGTGTPRDVTFQVSGLTGAPNGISLGVTFGSPTHTWMGDITTTLIAPNGASHTIFAHTGGTTATAVGDSSDLGAAYTFSDVAPAPPSGGWWQAATAGTATDIMPAGTYRTTAAGGAGATNPQPPTNMDAAFAGVSNPNGTWTLRLTDSCSGDTGAVTAANLTMTGAVPEFHDANADFNGDGRTDFTVVRGTASPLSEGADSIAMNHAAPSSLDERPARRADAPSVAPQAPPLYWYTLFTNNSTTLIQPLGDAATDFVTPEDFDGDGKDDLAVWTTGAGGSANFKVLQSSTNTVQVQIFGQDGDDPAVVGDYDGDNKADAAVYRCPPSTGSAGQCFFFYRGSLNNPAGNITYVPWGFGIDGDFFPYVGDFDGDGKNDFCIQRANPAAPASGQFVMKRSNDSGVEYINWGLSTDFLIPGDYDGDGKTDLAVRRSNFPSAGQRTYFILYRTGATSQQQWGITGDASVPGDYDGDGKTDLAIWRGDATPGNSKFWVMNSSNGSITTQTWGQCSTPSTCDFAVAGWAIH